MLHKDKVSSAKSGRSFFYQQKLKSAKCAIIDSFFLAMQRVASTKQKRHKTPVRTHGHVGFFIESQVLRIDLHVSFVSWGLCAISRMSLILTYVRET